MPSRAAPNVLETARLTLRAFGPDDVPSLSSLWKRNRDRFRDNFPEAVARIPRAQWNAVNMTGNAAAEARLTSQLQRSGLTSEGIRTVTPRRR